MMSDQAYNSFVYDLSAKIPLRKTSAKVIVEFRTSGSYQGEYGFDWIRMGDSGRPGDTWYANIMGNQFTRTRNGQQLIIDKSKRVYDRYASHLFRTKRFLIPWKKQGSHPFMYIAPVMTLRKGASAKLSLKVEVKEPAVKIMYKCQTPGVFKLSKEFVPILKKGKHTLPNELVITCLKEFSTDQEIKVYAYDANDVKHLAGKLIIKANDKKHQVTINVAIVCVKFREVERFPNIWSSTARLEKIFAQAYVNVKMKKVDLYITQTKKNKGVNKFFTPGGLIHSGYIDDGSLYSFLNAEFSKKFPSLGKFFKIYYINRRCFDDDLKKGVNLYGQANGFLSHEVIICQSGLKDNTAAHELLHCIGLPHSFCDINAQLFNVAFKENSTDNIMDYSDMEVGIPTIATWEYQWKVIQKSITNSHAGKW